MKARHGRECYLIVGEGMRQIAAQGQPIVSPPTAYQDTTEFRFSRFVPGLQGSPNSTSVLAQLALAMTASGGRSDPTVPAGYTYLGQFVDHDLTLDDSELDLQGPSDIPGLISQRSPTLDLDSLYGRGPKLQPQWYEPDGIHLRRGRPANIESPGAAQDGMDLPRWLNDPGGRTPGKAREARIPDLRNDENLAVAQVHAAFIRFHNRVADELLFGGEGSATVFEKARAIVTKHYQWMLIHDYLPRVVDEAVVQAVFSSEGRRHFEVSGEPDATMPVEFSGAAFRLGHSQIRAGYSWNRFFNREQAEAQGPIRSGHLFRLFRFSGTSGTLFPSSAEPGSPEDLRDLENPTQVGQVLPSNWVADWTRLFDLGEVDAALKAADGTLNFAMALDSHVTDPLKTLPLGSFGGVGEPDLALKRSLVFRNLARGRMLGLASGQQLAAAMGVLALSASDLLTGNGGVEIPATLMDAEARAELTTNTPLWFYVLREAEMGDKNRLAGVGARIVAETFHRAIEKSHNSMLADLSFKPTLGPRAEAGTFGMADLLHYAFEGRADLLNPHQ